MSKNIKLKKRKRNEEEILKIGIEYSMHLCGAMFENLEKMCNLLIKCKWTKMTCEEIENLKRPRYHRRIGKIIKILSFIFGIV